ncbi:DNA damage-regulated autophagy modulator protein 2b, partial [Poecilia reticulata]|uniref:DNA damage-regulated autophagy modulator protein 2b n=1 Tax=Poecilia reticulata TaxID=8081 RepID=UPI0007E97DD0
SDTGTLAPERCVFGIMMDVSAFLGIATVYVRYKQVEALLDDEVKLQRLNCFGLVLGWMSSFGMCVVANFQKTTLFSMHMVGAVLTFGVGALYILVQTLLSHYMQPHIHSKTTFVVRLTILVWTLGSIISSILNFPLPVLKHIYNNYMKEEIFCCIMFVVVFQGYVPHMVSTVSEWFLAFSFISFFLTYIRDFQKINLRAVAVLQSSHLYDRNVPPSRQNRPSETSPLLAGTT